MTEVPLSDIVTETVSSFEPLAAEKGREICMEAEPMVTVQGSVKELEKLVSILMENAVKYSAAPEIKVDFRKRGKDAVLEISNRTDTELTNESLSHVFERFYRTDSSRNSATGGHGIGLSMASAIVGAHKGKITARTSDGHDFIVNASIPLA
jgi:signal transduction histidine kinase